MTGLQFHQFNPELFPQFRVVDDAAHGIVITPPGAGPLRAGAIGVVLMTSHLQSRYGKAPAAFCKPCRHILAGDIAARVYLAERREKPEYSSKIGRHMGNAGLTCSHAMGCEVSWSTCLFPTLARIGNSSND